ncbi:DUF3450 domain-containing protein [Candidatus Poribacteria bacterium]|nr:DUF3450 domain-containing protein [Candidatus Poribacteria bacterium]
MSEVTDQSIVSLLEERVELAISTVQALRTEKLELEAEIARLNNDLLQRDAQIQDLEDHNSDLRAELDSERAATSDERSEIRERLEGLMDVLIDSDESPIDTVHEVTFEADTDESDADATEAEKSVSPRVFGSV